MNADEQPGLRLDAGLLGELCKNVDLYDFIERTIPGNSVVGKQMDEAGRWLFNHRFGGGHLWWKEFLTRPMGEWSDVAGHLAKDWFTPQGLPYAFDGTHLRGVEHLRHFQAPLAHRNWAMLTGFDAIAGGTALVISVYEARGALRGYSRDSALIGDGCLVALNLAAGLSTCNPLLIVAGLVRATTLIRRWEKPLGLQGGSIYDVNINQQLGCHRGYSVSIQEHLGLVDGVHVV